MIELLQQIQRLELCSGDETMAHCGLLAILMLWHSSVPQYFHASVKMDTHKKFTREVGHSKIDHQATDLVKFALMSLLSRSAWDIHIPDRASIKRTQEIKI